MWSILKFWFTSLTVSKTKRYIKCTISSKRWSNITIIHGTRNLRWSWNENENGNGINSHEKYFDFHVSSNIGWLMDDHFLVVDDSQSQCGHIRNRKSMISFGALFDNAINARREQHFGFNFSSSPNLFLVRAPFLCANITELRGKNEWIDRYLIRTGAFIYIWY